MNLETHDLSKSRIVKSERRLTRHKARTLLLNISSHFIKEKVKTQPTLNQPNSLTTTLHFPPVETTPNQTNELSVRCTIDSALAERFLASPDVVKSFLQLASDHFLAPKWPIDQTTYNSKFSYDFKSQEEIRSLTQLMRASLSVTDQLSWCVRLLQDSISTLRKGDKTIKKIKSWPYSKGINSKNSRKLEKISSDGSIVRTIWSERVTVKDASSLVVTFDRKCNIPQNVTLSVYGHADETNLLRTFVGPIEYIPSFHVHVNQILFVCTTVVDESSKDDNIKNKKQKLRIVAHITAISPKFPLACWILSSMFNPNESQSPLLTQTSTQENIVSETNNMEPSEPSVEPSRPIITSSNKSLKTLTQIIYSRCLDVVYSSNVASVLRNVMLQFLAVILRTSPGGGLNPGYTLKLFQEMVALYNAEKTRFKEKNANRLHSSLLQNLVEIMLSVQRIKTDTSQSSKKSLETIFGGKNGKLDVLEENSLSFPERPPTSTCTPNNTPAPTFPPTPQQLSPTQSINSSSDILPALTMCLEPPVTSSSKTPPSSSSSPSPSSPTSPQKRQQPQEDDDGFHRRPPPPPPPPPLSTPPLYPKPSYNMSSSSRSIPPNLSATTNSNSSKTEEDEKHQLISTSHPFSSSRSPKFPWPPWFTKIDIAVSNLQSIDGSGNGLWKIDRSELIKSHISGVELNSLSELSELKDPIECWPLRKYEDLTLLVNKVTQKSGKCSHTLEISDIPETQLFLDKFNSNSREEILKHIRLLGYLDISFSSLLPLVDLNSPWLGDLIKRCRGIMFHRTKQDFVKNVLAQTADTRHQYLPRISIDRIRASTTFDEDVDKLSMEERLIRGAGTVFGQSYLQLRSTPATKLRPQVPSGSSPHVSLNVTFIGEQALGQAGPYRAFFTDICRELQSSTCALRLLVPTPNNKFAYGEGREMFYLNPDGTSILDIQMLEYLGRLFGMAMRTRVILSIDICSLFWKRICRQKVEKADIMKMDCSIYDNIISPITECKDMNEFNEQFELEWTHEIIRNSSPLNPLPLNIKPGSRVSFDDRLLYCESLERFYVDEFLVIQCEAFTRGFEDIVSKHILHLFTASELQKIVCGAPSVDVAMLRRHTDYSGIDENSDVISWFWQVLEEFSDVQRQKFIEFAYATSRLPSSDEDFDIQRVRMRLKASTRVAEGESQDGLLPHADTCFFYVELPAYSSLEIMRQRLHTIVSMDWGMSGDAVDHDLSNLPSVASSSGFGGGLLSSLRNPSSSNGGGASASNANSGSGGGSGGNGGGGSSHSSSSSRSNRSRNASRGPNRESSRNNRSSSAGGRENSRNNNLPSTTDLLASLVEFGSALNRLGGDSNESPNSQADNAVGSRDSDAPSRSDAPNRSDAASRRRRRRRRLSGHPSRVPRVPPLIPDLSDDSDVSY